ncbi:DUF5693 family protein [Ureibacillus acetophenoni]|uniref:Uncharacterized protein n=1 Tax=Ureibacillus acetophenoni TaxID=614649 RepID=A0A285TYK3_9BACL|nr:DUF5693 family protein [Ureibacillus acetophenoni]SOC34770.1 hypothetical protein SAMN05877842_101103 [Ureibacillus acetophenoni]
MVKQKWLWLVVVALLIISIPGLVNRWNVETSSNNYEIIIPYDEILHVAENSELSVDTVLSRLKEAGLTTVSIEPSSLEELEEQGVLAVYDEYELKSLLLFSPFKDEFDGKKGLYVSIPEDPDFRDFLKDVIQPDEIVIGDVPFYFLPKNNGNYYIDTPIGYNVAAIEKINSHGLMHIFRAKNDEEHVNENIVDQLVSFKNENVSGILGIGEEMIGYGLSVEDKNIHHQIVKRLKDAGYYYYSIDGDNKKQRGEEVFAKATDYDIIRLISMDINKESKLNVPEGVDRSIRAIKERNIKSFFWHIREKGNAEENLDETIRYITDVQAKMEKTAPHFTPGAPILFDKISVPSWVTALVLLSGIIFTYIMSELVRSQILRLLATGFMVLLAGAYFVLDRLLFIQAFALVIACITPIYAVIKASNGSTKIRNILVQYVKAVGISLIGIAIVIGLLNGNGFISGYEAFRGVKLVYIVPIAGIALFVLLNWTNIGSGGLKTGIKQTGLLLDKEIKFWHLLVAVIVAAVGMFYMMRTGNFGPVSGLELKLRQLIEDILYVRPRTKEFLIGFPLFVLALYVMGIHRKLGMIFLIPGVIGFLSIVNTFTHLHIPIGISLLRTFYSVVLGFVVGLVFILIYKVLSHYYAKAKRYMETP